MPRAYLLRCVLGLSCLLGWSRPAAAGGPELEFVPNHGQWPAEVRLRADVAPGLSVFLENQQLTFLRYDAPAWAAGAHRQSHAQPGDSTAPVPAHAWAVELVGARRASQPVGDGALIGPVRSYFTGADPRLWATNLRATAAARYPDVWPGISLRVHASAEGAFEYDLEVAPGARLARARLRYRGLEKLTLDPATGHLILLTSVGELREAAPVAWQPGPAGERTVVPCRFELSAGNMVSFKLPAGYDRRRPLVIDPVLVAATYSGSTAPIFGHTATYDASGHLYVAGPCFDPGYPVTLGAFDLTHSNGATTNGYNNPDVAISRYSSDGRQLLYATYLGGRGGDYPHSLLVNHRGELLMLGSTFSRDFPTTTGAYDRTLNNGVTTQSDAFVARLDSTGAQLLGSTYVGGTNFDGLGSPGMFFFYGDFYRGDIAVDSLDRVFVATTTRSVDFPFTVGAVHPPSGGAVEAAVVLRLSADLSHLDWAAGLGSIATAYGLYLPPSGAPYVVGATVSSGFPTTPGTLDPTAVGTVASGQRDGFIAQLSPNGDTVRAATYLRPSRVGQSVSQTFFIQPDPASTDVYVLGSSTGFYSATAGKWGQSGGGLVIQRLSADLRQRPWVTTIGHPVSRGAGTGTTPQPDTDNLSPTAFLVDHCGSLYLSGWGNSAGLPVTPDALQTVTRASGTGGDLYLAVLDPDATDLHYASFLGGTSVNAYYEEHVDGGTSRFDPQGRVYQAVCTNAHNFPVSPGAWRPTNDVTMSAYDEVAFKLDFEPRIVRARGAAATTGGQPATTFEAPAMVQFTNQSTQYPGTTWQWSFGDGSTPSTVYAPSHEYPLPGTYTIQLIAIDPTACGGADTTYLRITVVDNDSTENIAYTICRGDSVQFAAITAVPGSFEWSPAGSLSSSTAVAPFAKPVVSTVYRATGQLPGSSRHTTWQVSVTVLQPDTVLLTAEQPCLPGGSSVSFRLSQLLRDAIWEFGDGSAPVPVAQTQAISHAYPGPGRYLARVRGLDSHGCRTQGDLWTTVGVVQADTARLSAESHCLAGGSDVLLRLSQPLSSAVWDFGDGSPPLAVAGASTTTHFYSGPGTYVARVRGISPTGCPAAGEVPVSVDALFVPNIFTPNIDGVNDTFVVGCLEAGTATLRVYSRWGRLVYDSGLGGYLNQWDGAGLASGLYFYYLRLSYAPTGFRGWVEIAR